MESVSVTTTSDNVFNIHKDDNEIKYKNQLYYLSPNIYHCIDQSNNHFLFTEYNYYTKTPNEKNNIIESISATISLLNDVQYIGYIQEKKYTDVGLLSGILENEVVIYGKKEEKLYFKYIIEGSEHLVHIGNIRNEISCKFIRGARYLCAYIEGNKVYVNILMLIINENNEKEIVIKDTKEINDFSSNDYTLPKCDNLILYNTQEEHHKILCCSNKINNFKQCCVIYSYVGHYSGSKRVVHSLTVQNLKTGYEISLSIMHICYLSIFNDEFLLCCGNNNIITCYRNNKTNFNLINQFSLVLSGAITNTTISNKIDHVIISCKNESSTHNYLYKYYIFPPQCYDVTKQINSFGKFEIDLFDLFNKRTNTKYYIRFDNFPSSYGIIKINEEEISSIDYKIEIKAETNKIFFISNNYQTTNNYDIIYNISIEETYSTKCKISLRIQECYHSCKGCSLDISSSNFELQNCIYCKEEEDYFPYSEKTNNCYNEQEMKNNFIQWFFDEEKRIFNKCYSSCKTCNGISANNCLSCLDENFYIYKGECIAACPQGTFSSYDEKSNKICEKCYPNCETCIELGKNMKRLSCSEDKIKYEQNCLIVFDNEKKRFHNPENHTEILSCLELYSKYIKENTNECIEKPKEGYFISNNLTGLLSLCHSSCRT